jgi:hypothetical protein
MFELNATDYSLLTWVQQAAISAHSLSIRFHQSCLVVRCQTLEQAMKLWETRAILHMPGQELCFRVNNTFYVGAALE